MAEAAWVTLRTPPLGVDMLDHPIVPSVQHLFSPELFEPKSNLFRNGFTFVHIKHLLCPADGPARSASRQHRRGNGARETALRAATVPERGGSVHIRREGTLLPQRRRIMLGRDTALEGVREGRSECLLCDGRDL
jgi:hypothetical protein